MCLQWLVSTINLLADWCELVFMGLWNTLIPDINVVSICEHYKFC